MRGGGGKNNPVYTGYIPTQHFHQLATWFQHVCHTQAPVTQQSTSTTTHITYVLPRGQRALTHTLTWPAKRCLRT